MDKRLEYKYSDEEMLNMLKDFSDYTIKNYNRLPTYNDIDNNINIPSSSSYDRRFGLLKQAFCLIGYNNIKEYNYGLLKQDMINKLRELSQILNKTPNSREINKYSKNNTYFYSMNAYTNMFGSLYNAQVCSNLAPTIIGRNKTEKDMIDDILILYNELDRIPNREDLVNYEWISSYRKYCNVFGGWRDALLKAGFCERDINYKVYYTKNKTKCLSYLEYIVCNYLENNKIKFLKEERYDKYISSINKNYRFDFVLLNGNEYVFVEIFGIEGIKFYDYTTQDKIAICKNNNINLICLYKDDVLNFDKLQSELEKFSI